MRFGTPARGIKPSMSLAFLFMLTGAMLAAAAVAVAYALSRS